MRRRADRTRAPAGMSLAAGTGSGGQPDLAHADAPSREDHRARLSGSRQAGRELGVSEMATSRVGPMSPYHRILVIGGDRSRLPPVAISRNLQCRVGSECLCFEVQGG
jgi:hypothetical protein